ncbi:cytosolic protein [Cytobacillus suaedae]|nr:cytosolic protein [Cytobacillus suaedae]
MKFIDELYEMYRHKLTGDEEDADILAFSVLEQLDRDDMITLIEELSDQELYNLVGFYMIEKLKAKMAREEFGDTKAVPNDGVRNIH